MRSPRLVAALVVMALMARGTFMAAQGSTGTITGLVKDSSGGVLPGSSVKLSNESTRTSVDLVTNSDGSYQSEPLSPGPYRVDLSLDGFETMTRRIVLHPGEVATVDGTLSPAKFSQSIVVTARRVEEVAQEVPIPVSVVKGDLVSDAGA